MAVSRDEQGAHEPLGADVDTTLDLAWSLRARSESRGVPQSFQRGLGEPRPWKGPPPGRLASSYMGPQSNETLLRRLVEQTAELARRLDDLERRLDAGLEPSATPGPDESPSPRPQAAANGSASSAIEELHAAVDRLSQSVDGEGLDLPPDQRAGPVA